MGDFGYFAEVSACIPFHYGAHRTLCMVGCRLVVERAIERVAVGGVCYH